MRISPSHILAGAGLPAFLVSHLTSISYLTGLHMGAGLLLILPRRAILFVDGRYREVVERTRPAGVTVRDRELLPSFLQSIRRCGFEGDSVTVSQFLRWKRKFKNTKFIRTSSLIEGFRRKKFSDELLCISRARSITEELLRRIPGALRSRPTERELSWKIEVWARELGAEGMAFDPIVAFGSHTSLPHHHPTSRRLKKGHIVQIDIGVKYRGYCADRSEVFFTVRPTSFQERVYQVVQEARDAAMGAVKEGVSTHEIDRIAREVLRKDGFDEYFVHGLGHGVGLEIHEGVSLSQKVPEEHLLSNEVITIEPGVYFPGRFGMRLEEMVVVR